MSLTSFTSNVLILSNISKITYCDLYHIIHFFPSMDQIAAIFPIQVHANLFSTVPLEIFCLSHLKGNLWMWISLTVIFFFQESNLPYLCKLLLVSFQCLQNLLIIFYKEFIIITGWRVFPIQEIPLRRNSKELRGISS